jgi:hypothetical protein
MMKAAGTVKRATPTTSMATGSVDREGDGASSTPTIPPSSTITGAVDIPRAIPQLSNMTFLFKIVPVLLLVSVRWETTVKQAGRDSCKPSTAS